MKWHYFLGACLLTAAILVPMGVPVAAVAGGITLATVIKVMTSFKKRS